MADTLPCRTCKVIVRSRDHICPACGTRRPGRNPNAVVNIVAVAIFAVTSAGVLWLHFAGLSSYLAIGILGAGLVAALFRIVGPLAIKNPEPRPESLIARIDALEARLAEIASQMESLADAFGLAKGRARSRLMDSAKAKLKRTYNLLKKYRERFDAQLIQLNFAVWMRETAAITSEWDRLRARELSVLYGHLSQRIDVCRVRFKELLTGSKTSDVYARASESVRTGLAQVDVVADAIVARRAQLALAEVSPASISAPPRHEISLDDPAGLTFVHQSEELEREFDRIMAENELSE